MLVSCLAISIHALQAESDEQGRELYEKIEDFNPRSPSGERQQVPMCDLFRLQFQSTLSKRRATNSVCVAANYSSSYFNPRSPSGERQTLSQNLANRNIISIHALQAESDEKIGNTVYFKNDFNPRSPSGERQLHACF